MSEAATTYTPRPGSKAEQAAMHLQARGELSTAELSDAIDCESGTLHALLAVPVKYGYLAREKRDGITRWRMGDGTPLPAEPDDDPPVQRIVSAAHAPKKSPATRAPHARSVKPARAKQAARANKAKDALALWNAAHQRHYITPQPAALRQHHQEPEEVTDTATLADPTVAAPAALSLATLPPLKAELQGGLFAGLVTLPDGTHHAVALLPARPDTRLTWKQAMAWAAEAGGQLPSRPIAALLYANARETIEPDWYWTNETEGSSYAWYCFFSYGYQDYHNRSYEGCAVAVRLIPLAA